MFSDLGCKFFSREAHGRHVVVRPTGEGARVGLHELDGRFQAVRHIHHGEHGVRSHKTCISFALDRCVEHLHRVVGGPAPWWGLAGDDPGVPHSPYVQAKAAGVIVTQVFPCHLGDPVHRGWGKHGVLWRVVLRGLGAENRDGAGPEYLAYPAGPGDLEHVIQAAQVHPPSRSRVFLPFCGKDRRQVVDRVRLVFPYGLLQLGAVGHVEPHRRPRIL